MRLRLSTAPHLCADGRLLAAGSLAPTKDERGGYVFVFSVGCVISVQVNEFVVFVCTVLCLSLLLSVLFCV